MNSASPAQSTALPAVRSGLRIDPFALCIFLPVLTWVVSYLQMALKYRDFWLFNNIVHENGELTLTGTILYFNHFMRELPMEAMWAVFGVGVFMALGSTGRRTMPEDRRRQWVAILTIALAAFTLAAVMGSINTVGFRSTLMDLGQARNRSELEWARGPHWRNHLLSNIASFGLFLLLVWAYRYFWCGRNTRTEGVAAKLIAGSVAFYVIASLAFGINSDPFINPQYVGHQIREIFGNRIPLSGFILLGTLIFWERRSRQLDDGQGLLTSRLGTGWGLLGFVLLVVPTAYLCLNVLLSGHIGTGIAKAAEGRDWTVIDLFAFHYFEHILDHVFVVLLASVVYLIGLGARKRAEDT